MYFVAYRTDDKRRKGDEWRNVEGRRRQRSKRLCITNYNCNNSCTICFNIIIYIFILNYALKSYIIIWRDDDDGAVVVVVAAAVKPGRRRCRWAIIVDFLLCTTTCESCTTISTLSAAAPFVNNQQ
jgi:hypothetical protein